MNARESDIDAINAASLPARRAVHPSQSQASDALDRILKFAAIANRPRLVKLLRYIVHEEVEDRGARLKGFTIAMDVFERDEDFDPQTDSIVRVEMFRLRQVLTEYYATVGEDDPLHIIVPKGAYRPAFMAQDKPDPMPVIPTSTAKVLSIRVDLAVCIAVALIGVGYLVAVLAERKPVPAPSVEHVQGPCVGAALIHVDRTQSNAKNSG